MSQVVSIVRGDVPVDGIRTLTDAYREATRNPPGSVLATYLVTDSGTGVAVITIWRDRDALDDMLASGQEPLARRLIREAGGEPSAEFFEVLASAT